MAEDVKFLAELKKSCATKGEEFEAKQKTRSDEMVAIHETIKILNSDDALELFKKTLPGASSFLQLAVETKEVKQSALRALKHNRGDFRIDLIGLALRGRKVSMDKVVDMIDNMVVILKKEQG